MDPIFRAARVVSLLVLAACATPRITSVPSDVAARVPFLRAGETQLQDVLDRLGEPAYRHDADCTMIWRAREDQEGRLLTDATWSKAWYELVLQFDAAGTYVRGSLVHAQ
jgi:hypothetical protein